MPVPFYPGQKDPDALAHRVVDRFSKGTRAPQTFRDTLIYRNAISTFRPLYRVLSTHSYVLKVIWNSFRVDTAV